MVLETCSTEETMNAMTSMLTKIAQQRQASNPTPVEDIIMKQDSADLAIKIASLEAGALGI